MSMGPRPNRSENRSPPWEVLVLVSQHLDHKTLAIASCVCKPWSISMSSDHLWRPICQAQFPSLSNLHHVTTTSTKPNGAVSYRRLYALGHAAAVRRRQAPSNPLLSLHDLVFAVEVSVKGSGANVIVSLAKPCEELGSDPNGVFKFDAGVNTGEKLTITEDEDVVVVRVTWNVVVRGWRGVFTMIDCEGKITRFAGGAEGWFSAELPAQACCSRAGGIGVVADVKVGLGGSGSRKVSVGILSVVSWRYVTIEDGLRYLQHFLL